LVDDIKMDLIEIGWNGMDWIELAQDRDKTLSSCTYINIRILCTYMSRLTTTDPLPKQLIMNNDTIYYLENA
jgi:hypothetical protein